MRDRNRPAAIENDIGGFCRARQVAVEPRLFDFARAQSLQIESIDALAFWWSMIFSGLPSPAEAAPKRGSDRKLAGFAKAGNRFPLFRITLCASRKFLRTFESAKMPPGAPAFFRKEDDEARKRGPGKCRFRGEERVESQSKLVTP